MPGGTGDEVPVAATSKRLIVCPLKMSLRGCHHSEATPVARPGGTHAVPVQNQAWRPFHVLTALVAATAVSSRPTPRPTAIARTTSPPSPPQPLDPNNTSPTLPQVPHPSQPRTSPANVKKLNPFQYFFKKH